MVDRRRTGASRSLRTVVLLVALSLFAVACGSSSGTGSGGAANGGAGEPVTITVLAAASLTDSFNAIAEQFEVENEGVTVQLSFAGSATLAEQILSGAPADVFASADTDNLDKLGDEATDPHNFATNTLAIAVPPGNLAGIETLDDLAADGLLLVICAPEVPCGSATQKVVDATGIELDPVSLEQSVTDVLGKVQAGEADAGVVYQTDVAGAGDTVEGIAVDEFENVVNTYPITTLRSSENSEIAQKFIEFVLSDTGQQILSEAGFGTL